MGCMLSRVCTPKSYNGKDVSFCVFAPYKKCKKGKNTYSFIQFNCLRHATASPSALVLPHARAHLDGDPRDAMQHVMAAFAESQSRGANFSLLLPSSSLFLLPLLRHQPWWRQRHQTARTTPPRGRAPRGPAAPPPHALMAVHKHKTLAITC